MGNIVSAAPQATQVVFTVFVLFCVIYFLFRHAAESSVVHFWLQLAKHSSLSDGDQHRSSCTTSVSGGHHHFGLGYEIAIRFGAVVQINVNLISVRFWLTIKKMHQACKNPTLAIFNGVFWRQVRRRYFWFLLNQPVSLNITVAATAADAASANVTIIVIIISLPSYSSACQFLFSATMRSPSRAPLPTQPLRTNSRLFQPICL